MKLKSSLYELLYLRICRVYARYFLRDRQADAIYRFLCSFQFLRVNRYWPNFMRPRRFTEKLWSRMLHDRDPQLTVVSDKLRVRDYVADRVGSAYLIPLLWSGDTPERIPFDRLPPKFVIKASHGSSYNIFVTDKTKLDVRNAKLRLAEWLRENYCLDCFIGLEWGYKNIVPAILVESFMEEEGKAPKDYKFYCFSGRVELITVHFDRFENHTTRSFDREFGPHEFRYHLGQHSGEFARPKNTAEMVQIAESLARGFDFIRVDLYNIEGQIRFGELTPYPGGTTTRFLPMRQDYALGAKWQ